MTRRTSGALAWLTVVQFFVAEAVVAGAWPTRYSRADRHISDLGATRCHVVDGTRLCSPDHLLMNASFVLAGVAIVVGTLALRPLAEARITPTIRTLYLVAGAGVALVGLFPEDTVFALHATGAALYFVGANVGHLLLGRRLEARGAAGTLASAAWIVGVIGLVGTLLYAQGATLGVGIGAVERIAGYAAIVGFALLGSAVLLTKRPTSAIRSSV